MKGEMPPTVNLFLVLNLGSEMLYVIDQRLRAQSIALDKSAQGSRPNHQQLTEATQGVPINWIFPFSAT